MSRTGTAPPATAAAQVRAPLVWALVAAGGASGTGLRLAVVAILPAGVLVANVAGSFLLGLVVARTREDSLARWLLGPGLLGSFTTFSAFALQLAREEPLVGALHASVAVALGALAALLGLRLGRRR